MVSVTSLCVLVTKARRELLAGNMAAFHVPDVHLDNLPQSEAFKRRLIDDLCSLHETPLAGLEDIADVLLTAGCLWVIVLKVSPFTKESVLELQTGLAKIVSKYKQSAPVFAFAKELKHRSLRTLPARVLNLAALGKQMASRARESEGHGCNRTPTCIFLEASELSACWTSQTTFKDLDALKQKYGIEGASLLRRASKDLISGFDGKVSSFTSEDQRDQKGHRVCIFERGIEKHQGWLSSIQSLNFSTVEQHVITRVGVEALNQIAEGDALLSKSQSEGDALLSKSQSEGDALLSKSQSEGDALLSKSQSEGDALLSKSQREGDALLAKSQSKGDALLSKSQSEGDALLSKSQSEGDALLSKSQRKGDALLSKSQSEGDALLSKSQRKGDALFSKSQSEGDALLSKSQRKGDASLSKRQSEGDALLSKSQRKGDALLSKSQSEGDALLSKSQSEGDALLSKSQSVHDEPFGCVLA